MSMSILPNQHEKSSLFEFHFGFLTSVSDGHHPHQVDHGKSKGKNVLQAGDRAQRFDEALDQKEIDQ
jgi:hypothetical protein